MPRKQKTLMLFSLSVLFFFSPIVLATPDPSTISQRAGIIEKLGDHIDLDLIFSDDSGKTGTLRAILDPSKPTILAPVYYECPRLCTLTQEGLLKSINKLELDLGKDYQIISVSFNYKESSNLAAERSKAYRNGLNDKISPSSSSWKFLVGEKEQVEGLMTQIGFNYEFDQGEYMHAAGLVIISPSGLISRYLFGIEFPENDLKLALIEAGEGKVGSFFSKAMMFCFRYDHLKGQYTFAIWNLIRVVSIAFVIVLAGILGYLRVKEGRLQRVEGSEAVKSEE